MSRCLDCQAANPTFIDCRILDRLSYRQTPIGPRRPTASTWANCPALSTSDTPMVPRRDHHIRRRYGSRYTYTIRFHIRSCRHHRRSGFGHSLCLFGIPTYTMVFAETNRSRPPYPVSWISILCRYDSLHTGICRHHTNSCRHHKHHHHRQKHNPQVLYKPTHTTAFQ